MLQCNCQYFDAFVERGDNKTAPLDCSLLKTINFELFSHYMSSCMLLRIFSTLGSSFWGENLSTLSIVN